MEDMGDDPIMGRRPTAVPIVHEGVCGSMVSDGVGVDLGLHGKAEGGELLRPNFIHGVVAAGSAWAMATTDGVVTVRVQGRIALMPRTTFSTNLAIAREYG